MEVLTVNDSTIKRKLFLTFYTYLISKINNIFLLNFQNRI